MSLIEKCERIRACEEEAARLKYEIEVETGRQYDEFMDGMRRMLEPAEGYESVEAVRYRLVGGEVDRVLT